jgi:hypothetical protein
MASRRRRHCPHARLTAATVIVDVPHPNIRSAAFVPPCTCRYRTPRRSTPVRWAASSATGCLGRHRHRSTSTPAVRADAPALYPAILVFVGWPRTAPRGHGPCRYGCAFWDTRATVASRPEPSICAASASAPS